MLGNFGSKQTRNLTASVSVIEMQPGESSPAKLRQEINFLRQKLEYQQTLLEDERRVTDELITNKNTAIETLQRKLREDSLRHQQELQSLLQKHEEVLHLLIS
jgi:Mg2+ and Co2+ transporter CorA